ncbi:phage protein Gp36 family protein [Flintibacter sp.]|uniref:phage protein Gp36 family protein n=1 Tax=Flintibacter sp. TaxID=1918624 RepID=UPI003FA5E3C6
MPDVFIGLKEAAEFEGVKYNTLVQRIKRSPNQYKTRTQPQENGGREQVLVSVDSLTAKGRKAWRAAQKIDGRDVVIEKRTESAPWYVGVDLNHYTEQHKKAFYEAVELAARVQDFIDYDGPDRTAYAERYALGLGVSLPTLYRYVDNILKANAWALKMEKEDGQSRDYFRALSLCRKPKATATFPSLTDEQKALIQNIWFDRRFAANLGTIEMLYEKFEEVAEGRGWENYPSIKTVARYIKHLMDSRGGESARYSTKEEVREMLKDDALNAIIGDTFIEDPAEREELVEPLIEAAIADADAEIDGYLAKRYTVPISPAPRVLNKFSKDIAVYNLFSRIGIDESTDQKTYLNRYNAAIKFLTLVAEGKVSIGTETEDPASAAATGFSAKSNPRLFTRAKMRGM